jgi:hypothetical protein
MEKNIYPFCPPAIGVSVQLLNGTAIPLYWNTWNIELLTIKYIS